MGGKVTTWSNKSRPYSLLHSGMMEFDGLMLNEKRTSGDDIQVKDNKTNIEIVVKYENNILISKQARRIYGEEGKDPQYSLCTWVMLKHMFWNFNPSSWCSKECFSCYFIKHKVSKKKKRYIKRGYNFDMSYITSRIIAMAYPSGSTTNCWRNDRKKLISLFRENHNNKVKIYNLCIEKGFCIDDEYEYDFGKYKILEFKCLDHEPHDFKSMFDFCIDATIYLSRNKKNTIAVHWKAGKGRTGLIIWALLIFLGFKIRSDEIKSFQNKLNLDKHKDFREKYQDNLNPNKIKIKNCIEEEINSRIFGKK